jgi:hypothetical protein
MGLFSSRHKENETQSFLFKLVNNYSMGLRAALDDPRFESRVAMTIVVLLIPVENGQPMLRKSFAVTTKDISTKGCSVVLAEPIPVDEVIVAMRWEGSMRFLRAQAVHLAPMGAGFFQAGFEFSETIHPSDYPVLNSVYF